MRPFEALRSAISLRVAAVMLLVFSAWAALGPSPASAEPRITRVDVYSESMGRWVANDVISPASAGPAPTFYLLTGIGGGSDGISWFNNTGVRDFFADKHVNVVMPIGGQYSMYTDWDADDPVLGRNKWQTYLTSELPAAIDGRFATTGANAIGGVSMAGGAVLDSRSRLRGSTGPSARTAVAPRRVDCSARRWCGRWWNCGAAATRPTCGALLWTHSGGCTIRW